MSHPYHYFLPVIVAVLLDFLLGDPRWLPHPVRWIGRSVSLLERWLRMLIAHERLAGVFLLLTTVACVYLVAFVGIKTAYLLHPLVGLATSAVLGFYCLAARSLHHESKVVADALLRGDLPEARTLLANIVGRDTGQLTEQEIWRALVETVSENSSDGVIAPLFYMMIGGPALALAYKAVNTLDSMVGYKNERYLQFGWASARCDDLANLLPARLTGLLMVLVAPTLGLSMKGGWRIMLRDGGNHSSPNSGIPEAAAAGALGVQLGGTNHYFGKPVEKPTIGDADRPLDAQAYRGALRLMYGAEVALMAIWLVITTLI